MTTHDLKVHVQFFDPLERGIKNFELRRDDRAYRVGDILHLREYNPAFGYTGSSCKRVVTYILRNEDLPNGCPQGWCVMALGMIA